MLNISNENKQIFRKDNVQKNIRIHFPNGEREDITNSDLIAESFSMVESICSQDNLKFGLCEANEVSFETINVGNIKGCEIEVGIEVEGFVDTNLVEYMDASNPYTTTYDFTKEGSLTNGLPYSGEIIFQSIGLILSVFRMFYEDGTIETVTFEALDEIVTKTLEVKNLVRLMCSWGTTRRSPIMIKSLGIYNLPLGTYVVKSCKRQPNMIIRNVIAYSKFGGRNYEISDYERIKMLHKNEKNIPYTGKVKKWIISNTNSLAIAEKSGYTEEDVTLDGDISTDPSYGTYLQILTVSPSIRQNNADNLYLLWYKRVSNYEYVLNNAKEMIKNYYKSISPNDYEYLTEFFFEMLVKGQFSTIDESTDYEKAFIDIKEGNTIVYPYVNKTYSSTSDFRYEYLWVIPYAIQLVDSAGNVLNKYTIASASVSKITLEGDDFDFSIARVKNPDGTYSVDPNNFDVLGFMTSYAEVTASFGRTNRNGEFDFININYPSGLYPSETLYPSDELYPLETKEDIVSMYDRRSLWYEEYFVKQFGKVIVDYLNTDGEKEQLSYVFDKSKENTYYIENNVFLNNHTEQEIKTILDTYFIPNVLNIIPYVPFNVEMRGLPYLEPGDVLNILTNEGGITSLIFRRTLTGIHSLTDSIETLGDETNQDETNVDWRTE